MRCIFCREEREPSEEHVFPLAIGGTVTTDRVCPECNSTLGSRVDAALSDFFPIRSRRAMLGLAGNGGTAPSPFELFLGKATIVGVEANQIHTTLDKATGKLALKQIPHIAEVTSPEGLQQLRITMDLRDKDKIPRVTQRERARRGLPALSDEELAVAARSFTVNSIEQPLVHLSRSFDFSFLRHAMMKIAYELAFLWLGEDYLEDPMAIELRSAICNPDPNSTDKINAFVGFADPEQFRIFQSWEPHQAHHLAYASIVQPTKQVVVAIRVFDIYGALIPVSAQPERYLKSQEDTKKLRFLAIDARNKKTIDSPFAEETRRIAELMTKYQRFPPFADPLEDVPA